MTAKQLSLLPTPTNTEVEAYGFIRQQLRDGGEPREPRVVGEQLQKLIRRKGHPETGLITHALGSEQGLVELLQGLAQFHELSPAVRRFISAHN